MRIRTCGGLVWMLAAMGGGCSLPKFDLDTVRQVISERPAELDRLNMLAGTWETSGEVEFIGMDEPIRTTGVSEATWDCDGRILLDRSEYGMGPLGTMTGLSLWTWDAGKKRYRMWWFDSFGETATGTGRFDPATNTLHFTSRGRSSLCNVYSRGTIRVIDENTLEWTYDQWDSWRILRFARMAGVSRRVAPSGSAQSSTSVPFGAVSGCLSNTTMLPNSPNKR